MKLNLRKPPFIKKKMIKSRSVRGRKTLKRISDAQTNFALDATPSEEENSLHQQTIGHRAHDLTLNTPFIIDTACIITGVQILPSFRDVYGFSM